MSNIVLPIPEDTEAQCLVETDEIHSMSCLLLLAAHGNSIFMTNLIMLIHVWLTFAGVQA